MKELPRHFARFLTPWLSRRRHEQLPLHEGQARSAEPVQTLAAATEAAG
jgi:hypothetical protein